MTAQTQESKYEEGVWYWVQYEYDHDKPPIIAPATYRPKAEVWYSWEFVGIPTRWLTVLERCQLPAHAPDNALIEAARGRDPVQTQPEALKHAEWLLRSLTIGAPEAAAELLRLHSRVQELEAERDEADRRAGAAERLLHGALEDVRRFEQVRRDMKRQWGADDRVSFDVVWQQALDAKAAQAQRAPLTDEQIEALPIWTNFCGLWPESRKEIARAIERAHGITQDKQG